jgi:hypothetical protein
MSSRTGLEAEAINRLTDGVQPPVMKAILVQCLAGDIAPSAAISRMLAEGQLSTVRAAIDDVTERAASISRASDMLVHDRVDELTQVFVENVAALEIRGSLTRIWRSRRAANFRVASATVSWGASRCRAPRSRLDDPRACGPLLSDPSSSENVANAR